jgi:hypothetical protein
MIRRNIKKGWEFVLRCFSLHMERMGPEQRVIVPNNPTLDLAGAGNPRDGGMGCRQLAYCTYGYSKYTFLYVSPDDVYQPHTVLWRSSLCLPLFFSLWPRGNWTTGTGTGTCHWTRRRACEQAHKRSSLHPSPAIMPTIICVATTSRST